MIMAIVNRTPDSFYDRGATYSDVAAMTAVDRAVAEGAEIVDIGGVKAGPGDEVGVAEETRQADFGIGALWGMQRNYRKRFSLDLNMGVGYYFWNEVTIVSGKKTKEAHAEFSPAIQFSLGFWLNRK